jgi:hypothetical protein
MKKYLLLLLLFPCLLTAQVSKDGRKGASIPWLSKLQTANEVMLRTGVFDNLPDSTYIYYDGILHRMLHITYNGDGWVVLEEGYTAYGGDVADDKIKREYAYTLEGDLLVQEAITFFTPHDENVWEEYTKEVIYYNGNGVPVRSEQYFTDGSGGWEFNNLSATVEYNEKGNPLAVVDSIPGSGGLMAYRRVEVTYDAQDRYTQISTFSPDKTEEWKLEDLIEVTYEGNSKCIESYYERGEKTALPYVIVETRYDERGNIISEVEKELTGSGEYEIAWEDTYRHVYPDGWISTGIEVVAPNLGSSIVYPNPSVDYVTVSLQGANEAVVTLINISGQTVSQQTISQQASIAVYSLPPGVYLLTVKMAAKTDVHKLIVR